MYWEDMPDKQRDCILHYISNCFNTYFNEAVDAFYKYNNLLGNYESFYIKDTGTSLMEKIVCYYFHKRLRNNPTFKTNYRPEWLKNNITGNNLELDVYWETEGVKYAVEYNGFPHLTDLYQIHKDILKKKLCKCNHVKLYTIQAYPLSEIDDISLLYFYYELGRSYRRTSKEYKSYRNNLLAEIKIRNIDIFDDSFIKIQKDAKIEYLTNLERNKCLNVLDEHLLKKYSFINLSYPVLYHLFKDIFGQIPHYINENSFFTNRYDIKRYIVDWFIQNKSIYHYLDVNNIDYKININIVPYIKYMKLVSGLYIEIDGNTYITISDDDKRNLRIDNDGNLLFIK